MVVRKRKKVTKYRAHTTHGGGHRKKRRGAGSRGGRGRAGTGKRASHKPRAIGISSGLNRQSPQAKAINVGQFTQAYLEKLVAEQKGKKEGDGYQVNLKQLGFTKLLGTGSLAAKVTFQAASATQKAQEKVKAAGGEVLLA